MSYPRPLDQFTARHLSFFLIPYCRTSYLLFGEHPRFNLARNILKPSVNHSHCAYRHSEGFVFC